LIMLGENVSLGFETGPDADATLAAAPADFVPPEAEVYPPAPAPVEVFSREPEPEPYRPPARQEPVYREEAPYPPPQPYTGQVPPGPAEPYYGEPAPEPPNRNRRMILIGCGCLLLLLCVCLLAGGWVFDSLNLYCDPPFDALSPLYEVFGGAPCP
jgi:hypothetical protein